MRCPPLSVYAFFQCCAVSPPHLFHSSRRYVRCPPPSSTNFSVRCPPPCNSFPLPHLALSCKMKLARWSHKFYFFYGVTWPQFDNQSSSTCISECVTPFKACWSKTFRPEINLALKIVSVKYGPCFGSKEFRSKKVGLKNVWSKKYLSQKKIGQMIWTNVPRTNVAINSWDIAA